MPSLISNTNQPSRGLAGTLAQPLTERNLDLDRLDQTVDRYQLLLLAKRVGKQGGFTPRMLQLLEYYVAYTTAKDWEEGSRPIVFQSLARTAMDLGVGERQIQKLEKRLFDIGAIAWNDSGNHKRFGKRDARTGRLVFAYGVDLTPLAYLQPELEAKLHEKQLYAEAWRATKREISETRRKIRERLEQLKEEGTDASELACHEASYREIAYELRSHIDLARLRELAKRHSDLHRKLSAEIDSGNDARSRRRRAPLPIAITPRRRSRTHAQKDAHQEQSNPVKKREQVADQDTHRPGTQLNDKPQLEAIGDMSPRQVAGRATEAFRAHLPAGSSKLRWNDVVEAAYRRRAELGISQQNWAEACASMGRRTAVAGLLLTDEAVSNSTKPVVSPSAYFRGVVDRRTQPRCRSKGFECGDQLKCFAHSKASRE